MRWIFHHPSGVHMRVAGPWPFVTFRSYRLAGRRIIWRDRDHRKGLNRTARALERAAVPFWQTQAYNWYTGAIFALGSFLFMLGSVLSLLPQSVGIPATPTNIVFFLGSIPFTTAAYMQHFQAANATGFAIDPASHRPRGRASILGWHPRNPGWLSTFTQFVGTIAFNFNTFDAIVSPGGWYMQDLEIWLPGVIGSILFLVSAYLAFIETSHGYWRWQPRSLAWQIVFVNLLGCVAFLTASILAYVPQGHESWWIIDVSTIHLLAGAFCFFVGAILSMVESRAAGA